MTIKTIKDFKGKYIFFRKNTNKKTFLKVKRKFEDLGADFYVRVVIPGSLESRTCINEFGEFWFGNLLMNSALRYAYITSSESEIKTRYKLGLWNDSCKDLGYTKISIEEFLKD